MQIGERLGPNPGNGGSTRMGGWQYGQEDYDDRDDDLGDDRGDDNGMMTMAWHLEEQSTCGNIWMCLGAKG